MTPRQKRVLDAIEHLTVDGVGPTYQEIADHLGYAAKSNVWYIIRALAERGLVVQSQYRRRSLVTAVVRDAESLPLDDMAGAIVRAQSQGKLTYLRAREVLAQAYARAAA